MGTRYTLVFAVAAILGFRVGPTKGNRTAFKRHAQQQKQRQLMSMLIMSLAVCAGVRDAERSLSRR